jgi:hypothetical protein
MVSSIEVVERGDVGTLFRQQREKRWTLSLLTLALRKKERKLE